MPTMHPIMVVTPEMLGVDDGSAVFISGDKTDGDIDETDAPAGSRSTPKPAPMAGMSRGSMKVEDEAPKSPPTWTPSVFVPPDGSAVFVHPDKIADSAPVNNAISGAPKTN